MYGYGDIWRGRDLREPKVGLCVSPQPHQRFHSVRKVAHVSAESGKLHVTQRDNTRQIDEGKLPQVRQQLDRSSGLRPSHSVEKDSAYARDL